MRKHFIFVAIAAMLLSFTSCEVEEVINQAVDEATGEASFTITKDGVSETITFSSAITDSYEKDSIDQSRATVALCANVALTEANADFNFPYAAFQFEGENAGNMHCHNVLTEDLLQDFCYDNVKSLLRSPEGANLLLIGKVIDNGTDTAWFISDDGYISVDQYPEMGHQLTGSITNMKILYFTTRQIEAQKDAITEAIENGTFDIHNFTTECRISGTFNCRRMAVIQDILNALLEDGVIER